MLPSHWPKWTPFLIALALVTVVVIVALIFEPVGLALAPTVIPRPTLPAINYSRPQSAECETCHFDRSALSASGASQENLERVYIKSASLETIHGSLGCITCHSGTGGTADKDAAHQGLILDLSETHPSDCLLCHRELPAEFPDDNLRTPHGLITDAVWEGSECGILCSDCHGQVGHGFDPVTGEATCSMSVCLDCHQEQNLEASLSDCAACHVGPHGESESLMCKDCHQSTDTWLETIYGDHPVELGGKHSSVGCFSCHRWSSFEGTEYLCSECHERPHEMGSEDCSVCHTTDGWDSSATLTAARAAASPHPSGDDSIDCADCHNLGSQTAMPNDHDGLTNENCQICHATEPAPGIPHQVNAEDLCVYCHGLDQVAQYPYSSHQAYGQELCEACHPMTDAQPAAVPHGLDGRKDCLLCHGPVRINPYPSDHSDRGNDLCLLCHESDEVPTDTNHTFPLDHSGAAENCELCHSVPSFAAYTCERCHGTVTVETIHEDRGVKLEGDCMECHEDGTTGP